MAKILVVDDEEDICRMLDDLLTEKGHEVYVAHDAVFGIEAFGVFKPDIVIVDIALPDKDGISVIQDIKISAPDQKFIAISGMGASLQQAQEAGVQCRLQKPFSVAALMESVRLCLEE